LQKFTNYIKVERECTRDIRSCIKWSH